MSRIKRVAWLVLAAVIVAALLRQRGMEIRSKVVQPERLVPSISQPPVNQQLPSAAEMLLEGYGDPAVPPIEDLRKVHRVIGGYFSVIKDASRFPIGGNEDLSAALKGANPNREIFLRPDHPVFGKDGLLVDRWGSRLVVHPEGWRQIELRSAGPDGVAFNEDDLLISPTGIRKR
jgi:hypothetical protein